MPKKRTKGKTTIYKDTTTCTCFIQKIYAPEVRKRRGHIFFEWNKCLWTLHKKINDRGTWTLPKTRDELRCYGSVRSSSSTNDTCCVAPVTNQVMYCTAFWKWFRSYESLLSDRHFVLSSGKLPCEFLPSLGVCHNFFTVFVLFSLTTAPI